MRRLVREYVAYFQQDRIHDALDKDTPQRRPVEKKPCPEAKVVSSPRLGGLHHRYSWREAAQKLCAGPHRLGHRQQDQWRQYTLDFSSVRRKLRATDPRSLHAPNPRETRWPPRRYDPGVRRMRIAFHNRPAVASQEGVRGSDPVLTTHKRSASSSGVADPPVVTPFHCHARHGDRAALLTGEQPGREVALLSALLSELGRDQSVSSGREPRVGALGAWYTGGLASKAAPRKRNVPVPIQKSYQLPFASSFRIL